MMSGSTPMSDLDLDDPEPSTSPDIKADVLADLPPKYHPWALVFSPVDVDQLLPHRPYDISIELEDGKSPPFDTMYRLSSEEHTALAEYIESNLK